MIFFYKLVVIVMGTEIAGCLCGKIDASTVIVVYVTFVYSGQKLLGDGGINGLIEENTELENQLELLEKDTVNIDYAIYIVAGPFNRDNINKHTHYTGFLQDLKFLESCGS